MSLTNYFISTTNIVNFQRFTNVFRGVVEQIYIKLDTQQDFRQNTPMRASNIFFTYNSFSQTYPLNQ